MHIKLFILLALNAVMLTTNTAHAEETLKFSYLNQGDAYHIRMDMETYHPNYSGYFDTYYGSGMGMQRQRSDKTTVFTFYPHAGIRGYTAVAPFFEVGLDALQLVFLPGKTYDWNYIDAYFKAGVSWHPEGAIGMELSYQQHASLFQKGNVANFIGLSLYARFASKS